MLATLMADIAGRAAEPPDPPRANLLIILAVGLGFALLLSTLHA